MENRAFRVILARPRGFCAGVIRAIEIVERALGEYGTPVFVLHEIVHNRHVVEKLKSRGARFVESLGEMPSGAVMILSAHGVSTTVVQQAKQRNLRIIDATCPLVTKVHLQAQRYSQQGFELIIIGHPGHPEVEGTRGWVEGPVHVIPNRSGIELLGIKNPNRLAYVTQTTLSTDDTRDVIAALKRRFPNVQGPNLSDICYATQSRQNAVRLLAKVIDLLLVVGGRNSSNSNRLREVGEQNSLSSHLIEDVNDLNPDWFVKVARVGITAGTSAPEWMVQSVLEKLRHFGACEVAELESEREETHFRLPKSLVQ
jgi:4-hydroxy-3-methylbut-2-enyl diphosphate reductase